MPLTKWAGIAKIVDLFSEWCCCALRHYTAGTPSNIKYSPGTVDNVHARGDHVLQRRAYRAPERGKGARWFYYFAFLVAVKST